MLANKYPARARVVATLPLRAALAAALLGMAVLVFGVSPAAAQEQTGDAVVAWGTQTNVPPGLGNAKAIAGGNFHSLAVKEDGTVAAWGDNSANQATVPTGLADVKAVAAGGYHSLALKEDGTVRAWGSNAFNQTDVPTEALSGVKAISAGYYHSLALKDDGTVVAWGYDVQGQSSVPDDLVDVKAISAGQYHNLALKEDGSVVGWGDNSAGQRAIPSDLGSAKAVAAGEQHSLAIKEDGTVAAWGSDGVGQSSVPTGLGSVKDITAGGLHSLALRGDGTVVAWGSDQYGQRTVPSDLAGVATIAAGYSNSLAIRDLVAPAAPLITAPAEGAYDNDGSFTLSGSAEAGSSVELFEGTASMGTAVADDASGQWSIELTGVPEGPHSYRAKATDAADNISGESEARTVTVDTAAPSVSRVLPQENATRVGPGTNVSARFSEAMTVGSISTTTVKLFKAGEDSTRKATVAYDGVANQATLDPSADLRRGDRYRVVITTGAKDLAGNRLDQDQDPSNVNQKMVWRFTVRN